MTAANESARTATVTTPGEREIRTERVFDAPRERVWRAYTQPEQVARWWGRGNRLVVERMEVQRGGHWRFVEHSAEGVNGFEGRFREVTPPERLVQSFEWDGMPGYVVIETTTFEDLDGGRTRVMQKIDGQWKMIHQHLSYPLDPQTGQARTDLEPESPRG
jgi:uncharacterized protein YndB with AHSA1/START domain